MTITSNQTADNAGPSNGAMDDRHDIAQLSLEDRVKVLGPTNGHETVRVSELGKDANIIAIFKLRTDSHDDDDDNKSESGGSEEDKERKKEREKRRRGFKDSVCCVHQLNMTQVRRSVKAEGGGRGGGEGGGRAG